MKFEVLENFKIKTGKGVIELRQGQTLEMDTVKASKLVETNKIKLIETKPRYEPAERDLELERYIGKPDMNPNGYKCIGCGAIGERYCLGLNKDDRFVWGWQCLKCRPYTEPERN